MKKLIKRVGESAALVGLKEKHLTRSPFDLSGGQKKGCNSRCACNESESAYTGRADRGT